MVSTKEQGSIRLDAEVGDALVRLVSDPCECLFVLSSYWWPVYAVGEPSWTSCNPCLCCLAPYLFATGNPRHFATTLPASCMNQTNVLRDKSPFPLGDPENLGAQSRTEYPTRSCVGTVVALRKTEHGGSSTAILIGHISASLYLALDANTISWTSVAMSNLLRLDLFVPQPLYEAIPINGVIVSWSTSHSFCGSHGEFGLSRYVLGCIATDWSIYHTESHVSQ